MSPIQSVGPKHVLSTKSEAAKDPSREKALRFRARLDASRPDVAAKHFRRLAWEMFGAEAFKRGPGERPKLMLDRAHLVKLADHPGLVQKQFEALQKAGKLPKNRPSWNADDAARLYSKLARSVLPTRTPKGGTTFTVATVNDDFTDRKTNVGRIKSDVLLVQEAKNSNLRKAKDADRYGVHQNLERDDKQGSAVLWNKAIATAGKRGYALGVQPHGVGMLTRFMSYTDLTVGTQKVRMISVHRPPKRFDHLWPLFDANLAAFVKKSPYPVVVGLDANQRNPQALAEKTGLKWRAPEGSIDGFLVSDNVVVEKTWRLKKGTSDHHPVVAKIRIKKG